MELVVGKNRDFDRFSLSFTQINNQMAECNGVEFEAAVKAFK